jgi:hypothetical protein
MNCSLLQILIVLASMLLLYYGYTGLKSGKVYIKGKRLVSKDDSPEIYWIHVVLYMVISILGIIFALFPELFMQIIKI